MRIGATLAQRFVHGSFWSLIGAVGAQGLTLVASIFIARFLGKEVFGQFVFLQGTVVTVATFAGFSLGLTATRYVASFRQDSPQRAGSMIRFITTITTATAVLASAGMFIGAQKIAVDVFHLPALGISIRWSALYIFCITVNGVQVGVLAGFEAFREIAIVNTARGIATLLLTIPLTYFWSVEGAFAAMGLAGAIVYAVSMFQIATVTKAHGILKTRTLGWEHGRVLWTFSLPIVLARVLVSPVTWLVSLWLSRQSHGYAELGIFGAANQWRSAVSFIPTILAQPLLPLLTSLGEGRRRSFERLIIFSAALNGGVAAIAGVIVLITVPLISMAYGKSFDGLSGVLIPLLIAGTVSCAVVPIGEALASKEKMWLGFSLNLIWAGCLIALAYFAIPALGARGLAYSFLGAYSVHLFTTGYCALRNRQFTKASGNVAV
jgi:O-antigen/teichoic acid export membrane protein